MTPYIIFYFPFITNFKMACWAYNAFWKVENILCFLSIENPIWQPLQDKCNVELYGINDIKIKLLWIWCIHLKADIYGMLKCLFIMPLSLSHWSINFYPYLYVLLLVSPQKHKQIIWNLCLWSATIKGKPISDLHDDFF